MLGTYFILLVNISCSVLLMKKGERKDAEGATTVYRRAQIVVPAVTVVVWFLVLGGLV